MNCKIPFSYRTIIFLTVLLLTQNILSQNESNVWYFGQFAGLNFTAPSPQVILNGQLNSIEGCSSISDNNGNLLFYSNGMTVWNRNHDIMPNGSNLLGDEHSTQSTLIVKKPLSDSIYYIFTTDAQAMSDGFRYSELDLSLNNGLGDITSIKNILLLSSVSEKMISIKHCNNQDFWIITHLFNSNKFYCYLLTETGLNLTPIINEIGITPNGIQPYTNESIGYMKSSPDGKRIALATFEADTVELFDFNRYNGAMSNCVYISINIPYGIEFSPNNQLLYVGTTNPWGIYQYDLTYPAQNLIQTSQIQVGSFPYEIGSLQRAVDNKIYVAKYLQNSLAIIENPNSIGSACSLNFNGLSLAFKASKLGLPNFTNRYLIKKEIISENQICNSDSINFTYSISENPDSVMWLVNSSAVSNDDQFLYVFSETGNHKVQLITYYDCYIDTITTVVNVKPLPIVDIGEDIIICEHSSSVLDAFYPGANYLWQDSSTNSYFISNDFGTYFVEVNLDGCLFGDSLLIRECSESIDMPNVFSPNHDGINDLFIPVYSEGLFDEELTILNRWGQQLYFSNDINQGWNGQYNGIDCSEGTYFWRLNYNDKNGDSKSRSGFFYLTR
jgi:gliding motility-associated-like protein